ncbi:hypothetical protein C0993_007652 [Termitomyces sp. T159_Od127]|nr:hypothetical protein C0993_007652 [Termitomyces sp. T159_Od127]
MFAALPRELYDELGSSIRGDIYARDEPGFEDYSTIFNGNVKSMSKAVVVPLDASDISKIVLFCNKYGLSPSIKAGGYGTAGWAIGGDVIVDLSKIVGVDIEPPNADGSYTSLKDSVLVNDKGKESIFPTPNGKRRRQEDVDLRRYDQASQAVATFLRGPGVVPIALQSGFPNVRRRVEVTQAPSAIGLTSGGTASSHGSGSPSSTAATTPSFGNGMELLRPSVPLRASDPFGYLTKDNPIYGRIVIINEEEHPDLWWAIRGAGPALGIVTRYKAKAYPVPVVFAGNLIYRFHRATAPSLIKHFRDCVKGAPRELYANVLLTAGPAGKDSLVVVQMCYIGTREQGQEYLAAISSWDGERCLLNEVDEKSFLHQQDSVAQVLRGKGSQWFIRSALITSLPDDLINETVMNFADTPVGCTWLFELAGGAIIDFEDTCVPKSQREASFTVAALHQWEMDVNDDKCVESAEEWIAGTLKPVHQGGPFPSFLGRHEPPERVKASFGGNWERLCEIKKLYDPNNVFKNTFWPLNAEGETVEAYTHEPPTP